MTPRGETAHRVAVREPTAALLALASDTVHADLGPPMRNAVRFTDAIHKTLARAMDGTTDAAASWLSGRRADGTVIEGHRHASLIPLALGRRQGRIDHLLVHCPMGLHPDARDALARLRVAFAKDLPRLFVTLVGLGEVGDFADTVPLVRPATVLRSATPFVPARFLKNRGRDTLVEQVQRELAYRSLPAATRVELEVGLDGGRFVAADRARIGARAAALVVDGGDALTQPAPRFRHFVQERGTHRPPARLSLSLRIELAEPATGPVALGYGSHFGLGLFEPERG